jgi:hypothetical protein
MAQLARRQMRKKVRSWSLRWKEKWKSTTFLAEPADKRKSSRIPKGNVYLKTALVEAANAAAKAKGTYLRDKFYRLKRDNGE